MADLIFVVVVVAFFALTVAYVRGCERIVGRDTGAEALADAETEDAASALQAPVGRGR
ncbi:MAG: hypothetical protein ACRDGH_10650 [Candidatus Limnocylindria bacterium]